MLKGKRKIQRDSKPGIMEIPAHPKPFPARRRDCLSIMFPATHSEDSVAVRGEGTVFLSCFEQLIPEKFIMGLNDLCSVDF